MIHLDNSGSTYEIGFQHGHAFPEAVRLAQRAYSLVPGVKDERLGAATREVEARLARHFPESLDEMRGIAEGAGLSYDDILVLNCYDAIIGTATGILNCSTIGFRESDAGVLLGKTADWNVLNAAAFTAWQRYQPEPSAGHTFVHYGCAGTLWSEGGLNEVGLGMVLNGLPVPGSSPDSVPWVPLTRGVLQHSATVQEALDFLAGHDVMCWGFSIMLADAGGDLALVEVTPGSQAHCRADGDSLIHTNHCLLPGAAGSEMSEKVMAQYGEPGLVKNSLARYRTLEQIVPRTARTVEGMQTLLRDRSPEGPISQAGEDGQHTVYAMVIAPAQGMLWGAEGYPPDVPFVAYEV